MMSQGHMTASLGPCALQPPQPQGVATEGGHGLPKVPEEQELTAVGPLRAPSAHPLPQS